MQRFKRKAASVRHGATNKYAEILQSAQANTSGQRRHRRTEDRRAKLAAVAAEFEAFIDELSGDSLQDEVIAPFHVPDARQESASVS